MLEVKTLKETPVPDPTKIDPKLLRKIIRLVDKRLLTTGAESYEIEKDLDGLVYEAYGISPRERESLGFSE